jgi:hypothetical protein
MLRLLVLALSAALLDPTHALPNPFGVLEAPCSGTGEPKVAPPLCYFGKGSVLGMSEGVNVTVLTYKNDHGSFSIDTTGVQRMHCSLLNFTRDATTNELKMDNPDQMKACLSGTSVAVKYCSDQDAVQLHINIPHFPIPNIPETLSSVPCAK